MESSRPACVVVGGSAIDVIYKAKESTTQVSAMTKNSTPCVLMRRSAGGVGRNIATTIAALGQLDVTFFTFRGDEPIPEEAGESDAALTTVMHHVKGKATPCYTAILAGDGGELVAAAADMSLLDELDPTVLFGGNNGGNTMKFVGALKKTNSLVLEGNLPSSVLEAITRYVETIENPQRAKFGWQQLQIFFDPVSPAKAQRALPHSLNRFYFVKPNEHEISAWCNKDNHSADANTDVQRLHRLVSELLATSSGSALSVVTCTVGKEGVVLGYKESRASPATVTHIKALPLDRSKIKKVTGAGDTFFGSMVTALTLYHESTQGKKSPSMAELSSIINTAQQGSLLALQATEAIPVDTLRRELKWPGSPSSSKL